jgi:cell division protein FtsB
MVKRHSYKSSVNRANVYTISSIGPKHIAIIGILFFSTSIILGNMMTGFTWDNLITGYAVSTEETIEQNKETIKELKDTSREISKQIRKEQIIIERINPETYADLLSLVNDLNRQIAELEKENTKLKAEVERLENRGRSGGSHTILPEAGY